MNINGRILFVDQSGNLGGAEWCLFDIVRGWSGDATVALFESGAFAGKLREQGVRIEVIGVTAKVKKQGGLLAWITAIPTAWQVIRALIKLLRTHDLLYANTAKALVLGALAARLTGKPLIYHLHDIVDADHFSKANRTLLTSAGRWGARAVIANSLASADAWKKAGGGNAPVHVIPNGFDPEPFAALPTREEARALHGMPPGPLLVMVGRLAEWKGQHVLLEALRSCPGVIAWLVGSAMFTDEDREYERRLRTLADMPELAGRVFFAGNRDEVGSIYAAADVVVHASTAPEPFGRVIVEGMLASRPVIASAAGGAMEIVEHEKTGLLVPPGDSEALASAIRRILEDTAYAESIAIAGRKSAIARYGLDAIRAQVASVVAEVLKNERAQA